jgi:hypothetical protein
MATGIAGAGINQVIDVADQTTKKALEAVQALEDAAVVAGVGVINVGDATFDSAMLEVEKTRAALIVALRKVAAAVVAPIDAIV